MLEYAVSCGGGERLGLSASAACGGRGGDEAASALSIPLASFFPSCALGVGCRGGIGGALFLAKKRLKEGEASIVVFGVFEDDAMEEEELTLVDLDQKEEKKVEEGVEEEVA